MPKLAVHLHLFYTAQLQDILNRLKNLKNTPYDLFVTMVIDDETTQNKIKKFKENAKIIIVPNLGYDIGPFIEFLHTINLDEYEYILKIQTKRETKLKYCKLNKSNINMTLWREIMFDSLLGSPEHVKKNFQLLESNPQIGMIGSQYIITNAPIAYKNIEKQAEVEMQKLGFSTPTNKTFVAGTMFLTKAALLKPFLAYKITDFTESQKQIHDNTLAHVLERTICWAVTAQGKNIIGTKNKNFWLQIKKASIKRFLFQKKRTKSGTQIIKICKIPVFYRKDTNT